MQSFQDIIKNKVSKRPTTYKWQTLALRIIQELNIPPVKKSSIFKVCRNYPENTVERAFNDTKELCKTGEKWQYFLKIISNPNAEKTQNYHQPKSNLA